MTHITILLEDLLKNIPANQDDANDFLSKYLVDDQCAIISAIYIGRDHISYNTFIEDSEETSAYFTPSYPYGRFYTTGNSPRWIIEPSDFARIIYEKASSLELYCTAFKRCSDNSGYDMSSF